MLRKTMLAGMAMVLAGGTALPLAAQDEIEFFGFKVPGGKALEKLIEKAQEHPLGAKENPVRADMPGGQRAYLKRLRCADGKRPTFFRVGNFGGRAL